MAKNGADAQGWGTFHPQATGVGAHFSACCFAKASLAAVTDSRSASVAASARV